MEPKIYLVIGQLAKTSQCFLILPTPNLTGHKGLPAAGVKVICHCGSNLPLDNFVASHPLILTAFLVELDFTFVESKSICQEISFICHGIPVEDMSTQHT